MRRSSSTDSQIELAWAAGLLEANGAFYVTLTRSGTPRARIQCRLQDRDVLERLAAALGAGRINGPYDRPEGSLGRKLTWLFQINRGADVARIAALLKPRMGRRRQDQIGALLEAVGPSGSHVSRETPLANR